MSVESAARARTTGVERALYRVGCTAACGLVPLHGVLLARGADAASALPIAAGLALGVLATDFLTGFVHWACDRFGDEHTPWVGPPIIRSFREHHRNPLAMVRADAIDVNGQPALAAAAALGLATLPGLAEALAARPFSHAFLVSLAGVGAIANQLHAWAHAPRAPRAVRALQRRGVILSPARHRRHHRAPHATDYCISAGWMNRPLDRLGFWRRLERAITQLTGIHPVADRRAPGVARTATVPPQPQIRRNDEAGRMARQGSHR